MSHTTKVSPRDLKTGDVLANGATILYYDRIGRGGYYFRVRHANGSEQTIVLDGRRRYALAERLFNVLADDH